MHTISITQSLHKQSHRTPPLPPTGPGPHKAQNQNHKGRRGTRARAETRALARDIHTSHYGPHLSLSHSHTAPLQPLRKFAAHRLLSASLFLPSACARRQMPGRRSRLCLRTNTSRFRPRLTNPCSRKRYANVCDGNARSRLLSTPHTRFSSPQMINQQLELRSRSHAARC
jgi:hypothetical protein